MLTGAGQLTVGRVKFGFFIAHIVSFMINMPLSFSNANVGALNLLVKVSLFGNLTSMLSSLAVAELLEALNFTPHLGALCLDTVGLMAELVLLSQQIVNADALSVIFSMK